MEEGRWVTWTPADVEQWVAEDLGFPEYAAAFAQNGVDGPTLAELTDETLEEALGISESIHRKKVIGHIKLLKIKRWGALEATEEPQQQQQQQQERTRRRGQEEYANAAEDAGGQRTPRNRQPSQRGRPGGLTDSRGASGNSTPRRGGGRGRGGMIGSSRAAPRDGGYPDAAGEYQDAVHRGKYCGTYQLEGDIDSGARQQQQLLTRSRSAGASRASESVHIYESATSSGRGNHWEEASVYSCYTNPDFKLTTGLGSYFGIDSPSYSRGGSFSRSSRDLLRDKSTASEGPGPGWYQASTSFQHSSMAGARASPRPVMARAPRNIGEHLISTSPSPGPVKYDGSGQTRIKGGTMGRAPRANYTDRNSGSWLKPKEGPGPADYRPMKGVDSTFQR